MQSDRARARERALGTGPAAAAAEYPWQAGIFPLATSIDDQPGRRVSVLLITAGGLVLQHDMLTDPLGRIDEVADALQAAIDKAEEDLRVAPRRLEVRHVEVARALGPRLAVRGIEVAAQSRLPGLEEAARSLAHHMLGLEALPNMASAPTWRGWGLSPTQCRALFGAAARLRRAAPWTRLDDDPITVWGFHGAWTAAVMGCGGEAFGLSLYTDPRDYEELYAPHVDTAAAMEAMHGAMITLAFEARAELTREMQREVAAAGWEVADPAGYPVLFTVNTPAGGLDPAVVDVLSAILQAIPDFLDSVGDDLARGLAGRRVSWEHEVTGLRLSYEVPGGFVWPVPARLGPGGPVGIGADPQARLGHSTPPAEDLPDAALVEAFERQLKESVSGATAAKHAKIAASLVEFLNDLQGVPLRAMHEYDLRTFLYSEFPRSRPGFARIEALPGSLRKFFAFLAQRHGLGFPWADALLADKECLHHRTQRVPVGPWWDSDVRGFLSDVSRDLDRRAMLLPSDWAGAVEPAPFPGMDEVRLREEAQRRWLVWRDGLILEGVDTAESLGEALRRRLGEWLQEPDPDGPSARARLDVIRSERGARGTHPAG